jgi:hypothetical protein
VVVTGYVRLLGNIRGDLTGRVVKADLLLNEKVLWSGEVHSGEKKDFEVGADVAAGDRVRLRIQNAGDKSGDLAAFNMHVETGKK